MRPGGLRVMDEYDVPLPDLAADPSEIRRDGPLVGRSLARAELSRVPGRAVETVVDSLGDGEEVGLARDDEPLGLDAGTADVAEERRQHLGDAASGRGRVDVHHPAAAEELPQAGGGPHQRVAPLRTDQRLETAQVQRPNLGAEGRRQRAQSRPFQAEVAAGFPRVGSAALPMAARRPGGDDNP
jgi:hypothetical protein